MKRKRSQNAENLQGQAIDEWDLTATNLDRIRRRDYEVAVLPVGAMEPHNRHLPQGQDYLHTTHVARRCCELAWEKSPSIICLPTLPYGVDCNLMDFPLAIHVSQATLDAMVREIIVSLLKHGIRKIVIMNGHGGNEFMSLIRQMQSEMEVHIFLCNWWQVGRDRFREIFEVVDDHAGEFETSVGLALYPELVELEKAGEGLPRPFRFEALEKRWVRTSRRFSRLNDNCAAGDPRRATAEKGEKYLEIVYERISSFLVDLAQAPIDENFPHVPG